MVSYDVDALKFQHLVDVINQTDLVEDIDGEEKLSQLMLNFSSVHKWGIVDWLFCRGLKSVLLHQNRAISFIYATSLASL